MRAIYKYAKRTELFEVQAARGDADALTVAAVGIQRKSMRLLYYGVVGVAEAADHSMGWGRAVCPLGCWGSYVCIGRGPPRGAQPPVLIWSKDGSNVHGLSIGLLGFLRLH